MVEPTESESLEELDRFVHAMVAIREEIRAIENGDVDREDNEEDGAAYGTGSGFINMGAPIHPRGCSVSVARDGSGNFGAQSRADNAYGDRNLVCSPATFGIRRTAGMRCASQAVTHICENPKHQTA